jgi:ABC-type Zn uptake system ZnuABC Zn-binding protein ZnuA
VKVRQHFLWAYISQWNLEPDTFTSYARLMSTVEEIESAVSQLAPSDYAKFRQWLSDYHNRLWDEQMEQDVQAGCLDALAKEALDDLKNGRCTDL